MDSNVDVVIIGAGWQGLAAAKTYLDVQPDINLLILDANASIGGTWATENFPPELNTQNLVGALEYTWYPLQPDEFDVKAGSHISAGVVHDYLQRVADNFGLSKRIMYRTKVICATRADGGGWALEAVRTVPTEKGGTEVQPVNISCKKLIVATGLASSPRPSALPGVQKFKGNLLTYNDILVQDIREVLGSPDQPPIAVVGGSKAAHDLVYWSASRGYAVNWLIEKSGHSLHWSTQANVSILGFPLQFEKATTTRFWSLFSPCVWACDGYEAFRWLLHETWLGRKAVNSIWNLLGARVGSSLQLGVFKDSLTPGVGFQWQATSAGINNYGVDLFPFLSTGQVKVYRGDIADVQSQEIVLQDGTAVPAQTIVQATGWKWTPPFRFKGIDPFDFGLPCPIDTIDQREAWQKQCDMADISLIDRFPYLRNAPKRPPRSSVREYGVKEDGKTLTPWRLYRAIAPPAEVTDPSARDLVFLGLFNTYTKSILLEVQALWAVAYLEGKLQTSVDAEKVSEEVCYWSRWGRLRYPYGHGAKYPDTGFDAVPYFDVLLRDVGVKQWRKGSWWRELFEAYGSKDYEGIIEEFVRVSAERK